MNPNAYSFVPSTPGGHEVKQEPIQPKMQRTNPPVNPNNANRYGMPVHAFYEAPQMSQGYENRGFQSSFGSLGYLSNRGYNQRGDQNNFGYQKQPTVPKQPTRVVQPTTRVLQQTEQPTRVLEQPTTRVLQQPEQPTRVQSTRRSEQLWEARETPEQPTRVQSTRYQNNRRHQNSNPQRYNQRGDENSFSSRERYNQRGDQNSFGSRGHQNNRGNGDQNSFGGRRYQNNRGYNQRDGYQNNRGYNQRGGYGHSEGEYGRSNYGRSDAYQSHYQSDWNDRHSSYENRSTWDKSVFDEGTNAGINFDAYEKIEAQTRNYDGFEPAETFQSANLDPNLLNNIARCGYIKPTPIQKYAIPVIMAERDLMACAQTGSGKTAAFLLPIINCMLQNPKEEVGFHSRAKCYPKALILSPTRELAQQIHKDCGKFIYRTNLGAGCIFGGSKVTKQLRFLESHRVDILVATVGRLWDFFERGKISFEDVHYLILDEADNMLDMGFEQQINQILYESDLPQERLNLLFSATMPNEIQRLASEFLNNYVFLSFGMVGSVTSLVDQSFRHVEEEKKFETLIEILLELGKSRVLVFTAMKRTADDLEYRLGKEDVGRTIAIHGDKTQRDRERALSGFRKGRYTIMIATDVAARGLDIKNISHVIQYDLPGNVDYYVHRVGRTGRCGHTGSAIAFVNGANKNMLRPLLKQLSKEGLDIPQWLMELNRRVNPRGGRNYGKKRFGYKRGKQKRYNNNNRGS